MARDTAPMPAIVREFAPEDSLTDVLGTPYNTVSFRPGFGDAGYKVETVAHDCPSCNFDRMVRRHDVHGETPDMVRYWCLNPNCQYYVSDYFSYACNGSYPHRQPSEPAVTDEVSQ